jgi:hypothetical protein
VAADTILRRSSNVMVLQNGVITSCDEDDPHYSIKAKRVWLLGDKEWAMSNAVFSLGNVPILWVPFFYYPGEEIVFHPVIGYRSREGRFLQTTTYLVGAKPPKQSTTTLVSYKDNGNSKPTELRGIFLRRVSGKPPEDKGTLKVMADYYSGLGAFTGLAGSFTKLGGFGKTSLYLGLGRSRSLFPQSNSIYSPYVSAGDYESVWNSSNLLGISMPVRYGLDLSTTYSSGGLTANIALPLYSDPYFEQDFTNRAEDMDWFKMFKSTTDTGDTNAISTRSQLNPRIETSYSLKPTLFGPYLSSIDVSRLNVSAILNSKSATAASLNEDSTLFNYDPNRTFFYPYVFRPVDASITFKGTLFNSSPVAASKDGKPAGKAAADEMRNPWLDENPAEEEEKPAEGDADKAAEPKDKAAEPKDKAAEPKDKAAEPKDKAAEPKEEPADPKGNDEFRLPARAPDFTAAKDDEWKESLDWSLTPSAYYEDSYLSNDVLGPADVDYDRLYSLYSYKLTGTLDGSASYGEWLSSSLSLAYSDQKQERPYLDETDSATAENYRLADKTFQSRALTQTSKLTLRPLAPYWLWSGSNVSWGMISTIYGYKYDTSSSSFEELWMSWSPETITSHSLSAILEIRPSGLKQSLALTATLPPVLESYAGKLSFDGGFGTLYSQTRMYRSAKGEDFKFEPLTTGASLGVSPWPVLTNTFVYAIEEEEPQSNVAGLSWGPASLSLTSTQTQSYKPVAGTGWVAYGDRKFAFSSVAANLNPQLRGDESSKGGPAWSFGLGLSLSQSLVRFTDSSLGINLSASYKVNDSLNLTLSCQSLNSAAWRYFPWAFKDDLAAIGRSPEDYAVNPLSDLWKSLSLWDKDSQKESLIKLKSLSLKAAQDLHDWTLSAEVSTKPLYDAVAKTYSLDTTFSILLSWKDIPDIKTTITKQTGSDLTY